MNKIVILLIFPCGGHDIIFLHSFIFSLMYLVNHEKCICKNNSSRTRSKSFMIQGMQRTKISRGCNRRNMRRVEEYMKFVEVQDKEMENFVAEKEKLLHAHGTGYAAMKRMH
ncbi:hypothetical protein AAZV13_15G158332 [Glycine max]